MGLLRVLLLGRPDGFRARFRRRLLAWFRGEERAPAPTPPPPAAPRSRPEPPSSPAPRSRPEPPRDVVPPEGFEVVLHRDALADGEVTEVIVGGRAIAVARRGDAFHALDATCPHAGGPLGEGTVEDDVLVCPYHGWRFELATGRCRTAEGADLRTWEVRVEGDAVCVRT